MRNLALAALAFSVACKDGKDSNTGGWVDELAAPEEATDSLYELEGSSTAQVGAENQEMGCIGFTTEVTAKLYAALPTLTEGTAEPLWDRSAALYADREEVMPEMPADSDGALRLFTESEEGVSLAPGDYRMCLVGTPGSLTGTFQYQIASPDQFATDGYLGADQDFPVAFTPFTVE
jgi:hypothetical protein